MKTSKIIKKVKNMKVANHHRYQENKVAEAFREWWADVNTDHQVETGWVEPEWAFQAHYNFYNILAKNVDIVEWWSTHKSNRGRQLLKAYKYGC